MLSLHCGRMESRNGNECPSTRKSLQWIHYRCLTYVYYSMDGPLPERLGGGDGIARGVNTNTRPLGCPGLGSPNLSKSTRPQKPSEHAAVPAIWDQADKGSGTRMWQGRKRRVSCMRPRIDLLKINIAYRKPTLAVRKAQGRPRLIIL